MSEENDAHRGNVGTCSRCGNEAVVKTFHLVRPGGMTWFTLYGGDFTCTPQTTERVCGACMTDREILLQVGPIAEFALSAIIKLEPSSPLVVSLETARTFFMVRNNDPDSNRGRQAALRAIGF